MVLVAGFTDPSADSARAFRVAMQAMARPGMIHDIEGPSPAGLSPAAAALLLVLADRTTPVRLAGAAATARDWLTFHTGAPLADTAGTAQFAVGTWADLGPLDAYSTGTADYPDRSATLIVETDALTSDGPRLTGPGIETAARLNLPDPSALARNAALYPLGLDFYFCASTRLAALPRSTRIEEDA